MNLGPLAPIPRDYRPPLRSEVRPPVLRPVYTLLALVALWLGSTLTLTLGGVALADAIYDPRLPVRAPVLAFPAESECVACAEVFTVRDSPAFTVRDSSAFIPRAESELLFTNSGVAYANSAFYVNGNGNIQIGDSEDDAHVINGTLTVRRADEHADCEITIDPFRGIEHVCELPSGARLEVSSMTVELP